MPPWLLSFLRRHYRIGSVRVWSGEGSFGFLRFARPAFFLSAADMFFRWQTRLYMLKRTRKEQLFLSSKPGSPSVVDGESSKIP